MTLGASVDVVCRKMSNSDATFYSWRKKYSGLGPSELRCVNRGEDLAGHLRELPTVISETLQQRARETVRVGIETGPLAVWLYHKLHELGVPIVCIHARHVHATLSVQLNKTDGNDTHGIAQLVRSGWYRPVEVKNLESLELRLLLSARAKLVGMPTALYSQIRGVPKTFCIVRALASER
jgi:transposase